MTRRGQALLRAAIAGALALAAGLAHADKAPLSDDELGEVSGKGVAFLVHLELNAGLLTGQDIDSRISTSFEAGGTTTWLVAQNFGGLLNLFAITLDPRTNANGQDYLAIGMPTYIAAKEFGVRAIGVQTDPTATISGSLGSLLLNGSGTMTGQLNVWPK